MMAIVVLGILIGIGVPSFREAALGSRLSATANNMLASAQLARSEAIKRNQPITLCRSADGATCASADGWEQGWIIRDAAGTVISTERPIPADLRITQAGGYAPLTFQPIGIGATAATFTICRPNPVGSQERVLQVTATGNTSVTTTRTGTCP